MPRFSYPVLCYTPDCDSPAAYKIAARWSDGFTHELKTYGLCCARCLPRWFREACSRRRSCRLDHGESLEVPGIYELTRGVRDRELTRRTDLEAELLQGPER
jgi:hypothetical protein